MSRIRLTNKTRIASDSYDPYDPTGSRPDYKKSRYSDYSNFDPAKDDVGGRGDKNTDGSTLNKQDNAGRKLMNNSVGEMKLRQARAWQASKLATKLAIYLLGQKAPSSMVKAQAAQFLSLGNAKLAKAVNRFAKTEYLYAEDDSEEEEKEACGLKSAEEEAEEPAEEEAEKTAEEAEEPAEEEAEKTAEEAEKPAKEEAEKPAAEEAAEEAEKPAEEEAEEPAEEEKEACGVEADGQACPNCGDEGCDGSCTVAEDEDEIDQAALADLFESNSNNLVAKKDKVAKSKKVGVQKLEQPKVKVASSNGVNLESIWESAPDVSKIFN